MWMPTRCAASRMVSPRSPATSWPSMVRSTWSGRAWVRVMSSAVVAICPLRFLTGGRGGLLDAGPHLDGVELADLAAGVALDAVAHVDDVRLFLLAADAAGGALLGAEHAAGAGLGVDVVGDQRLALARRAAPLADVRVQLIAEVAQGSEHRVGRRSAESAERAFDDVARELLQQLDVSLTSISRGDALQSLQHALGAQPTGHALAARLVLSELQEEARQVDHAVGVVDHHKATGADDGARGAELLVVDLHVEHRVGQAAARRPAELHGLERASGQHAAADVEDDMAQRGAHRHLHQAAVGDLAGEREDLCTTRFADAHGGESLDVVDVGGSAPEPRDRGERRTGARHAALALDACDEGRLLAADERAGALADAHVESEAGAQNVEPQQTALTRLHQGGT